MTTPTLHSAQVHPSLVDLFQQALRLQLVMAMVARKAVVPPAQITIYHIFIYSIYIYIEMLIGFLMFTHICML